MEKKRKWEKEYEKYSTSTELDERLEYLQDLINGKVAIKEEYAEHKRLTAIKANLPKVKNILELRGKLEEQRAEIKAEITRREFVEKIDKTILTLENEMTKLETAQTVLQEKLKDTKLSEEEKTKIEKEIQENEIKKQANNIKFAKCHEGKETESKKAEQSKFKDVALEDLKNKATSISSHISQCNLACNKLMQGFSWQSIETTLDKFQGKTLKAKGKETEKMKQNKEAAKENVQEEVQQEKAQQEEVQQEEEEEMGLSEVSRWQKAKKWLVGIGSKAVNGVKKIFEKFRKTEEIEKIEEEIKQEPKNQPVNWSDWYKKYENPQQVKQEVDEQKVGQQKVGQQEVGEQNDFRKYLKDIAEKGMDGVEKEEQETRRQAAIRKLIENKRNARGDDGGTIAKLEEKLQDGEDR